MAYVLRRLAGRPSTKLISARIQRQYIEFADNNGFVFNKWTNRALETLIHDLQTDYNCERAKRWLIQSGQSYTAYVTDGQGSEPKMLRVQTHLLEYLKLNRYKVNAAINLAFERWIKYYKEGRVADYIFGQLQRRTKY